MNHYAVIDLGTNTFHLLIAFPAKSGFKVLYKERRFVKLAENGIEYIGEIPYQRGLNAIHHFNNILKEHQVQEVRAFGTAALRTASNGQQFIEEVQQQTGIVVQLISGDREAALIHKGVVQALPTIAENILIMDIGGGSVEFIISNQAHVFWAQSFSIGVAVLFNQFKHSDPATYSEVKAIENYLASMLLPLKEALTQIETHFLVGASGTFDVLENNLPHLEKGKKYVSLSVNDYTTYYEQLVKTTLEERLQIDGIPNLRAEMLIVAFILVKYVFSLLPSSQRFYVSDYAMKEGILAEMMTTSA